MIMCQKVPKMVQLKIKLQFWLKRRGMGLTKGKEERESASGDLEPNCPKNLIYGD